MRIIYFFAIILLLINCKPETRELPILSYTINDEGEQEYYSMEYPDGFVNQLNQNFTSDNLKGKIVVANFFFTRCPSICPPMRQKLIEISNDINHEDFMIVSHTIDPENDTPEVLKDYAESTGISNKKWQFVTAPEETNKQLAKQYMTNFKPYEDGTDFYHSSYIALVDRNRMIRGFYNMLAGEDIERLKEDIILFLE